MAGHTSFSHFLSKRRLQSGAPTCTMPPPNPPITPSRLLTVCASDSQLWFHSVWVSSRGLASDPPCWGVVSKGGRCWLPARMPAWLPPRGLRASHPGDLPLDMLPDQPCSLAVSYHTRVDKGTALLLFLSIILALRRLYKCVT